MPFQNIKDDVRLGEGVRSGARLLRAPEEFRELRVALAVGVLDVGLQTQGVA